MFDVFVPERGANEIIASLLMSVIEDFLLDICRYVRLISRTKGKLLRLLFGFLICSIG